MDLLELFAVFEDVKIGKYRVVVVFQVVLDALTDTTVQAVIVIKQSLLERDYLLWTRLFAFETRLQLFLRCNK